MMRVNPITGNPGRYHGNLSCCCHYWKEGEPNRPTELGEKEKAVAKDSTRKFAPSATCLEERGLLTSFFVTQRWP